MTLLDVVVEAESAGQDPELALFAATASRDTRRAAGLLAVSIALQPPEFAAILDQLWDIDARAAIESLLRWPFVEYSEAGWRVTDGFATALANDFREFDRVSWKVAHELLAEHELSGPEEIVSERSEAQQWFIEARLAYYLAVDDPATSVRKFGKLFTHPPVLDPDGARSWLTAIVARQEVELASQPRERSFFRGYSAYSSGLTASAVDYLTPVYEESTSDPYAAFALYLVAVSIGLSDSERSLDLLQRSITLSEELELIEPEIRARHSFVWNLFRYINVRAPDSFSVTRRLEQAKALAHVNKSRAEQAGSVLLIVRSIWTTLVADWLLVANVSSDQPDVLRSEGLEAVRGLVQVRDELLMNGDPRAAILTTRDAMSILGQLGLIDRAIDQGDAAIELAQWIEAPAALQRVEAEAQNLVELTSGHQRMRVDSVLEQLKALSEMRMPRR